MESRQDKERRVHDASKFSTPKGRYLPQGLPINTQIDDLSTFLDDFCQSFTSRKQAINHIINKAEDSFNRLSQTSSSKLEERLNQIEIDIHSHLNLSSQDVYETQRVLADFVTKQWAYFQQACKRQISEQRNIIEVLIQKSTKRVQELKSLLSKSKTQARQGTSITKLQNLLKEKCIILEKELISIKDNTSKTKKECNKHLKTMLAILKDIQQGRADRQSKQQSLLAHIENIGTQEQVSTTMH